MPIEQSLTPNRQTDYKVKILYDVRIPTDDPEVSLSADVYFPAATGRVPALVSAYPYRKDVLGPIFDPLLRWFAEHGYASLLVDLRGTGSSDGIHRAEFDSDEGDDAIAAIEWAAAQPWCTGYIGMWGHSYGAAMTLRAASRRPPQLKAIIPIQGLLDPERYTVHPDGARGDLHALGYRGGLMLTLQLLPSLLNYTSVEEQRRWHERLHNAEPVVMDLARYRAGDPVWRERVIDASSITAPALCVGGWRDVHCESIAQAYEQISGPKKLLMGPWEHTLPQSSTVEPIDFSSIALRWWDHWLRGVDNGVMDEPPVVLYLPDDKPAWRAFEAWPPTKSNLVLSTGVDTTLLTKPTVDAIPARGMIAEYRPDPTTGALSGLWATVFSGTGPQLDQHDDDVRALSATSEPLPVGLLICGRPEALVRLAGQTSEAEQSVERLVIRLTEVDASGRSTFITGGVVCPDEPSATHRVVLRPAAYRVRAGSRLRVVLSDSDFPRLTPLPHPAPIRVAGIELSVPTLPDGAGGAVEIPAVERPPSVSLAARPDFGGERGRRWTITRDPIHDGVEVAMGTSGLAGVHTSQGHLLETRCELHATVRRATPDAAVTTGTNTAVARMNTGEIITATAIVRCTQTALWVRGEVSIDDVTMYSRVWEAPLRHARSRLQEEP